MERRRRYSGHIHARRAGSPGGVDDAVTQRRTAKLVVCAAAFLVAALMRLCAPGAFAAVGEWFTTSVDYKTALAVLGEGISGERKFIAAVGDAFTFAFKGTVETPEQEDESVLNDGGFDGAVESFEEYYPALENAPINEDTKDAAADSADNAGAGEQSVSDAIISAFLETQEIYSDYNLPAGTTYEMPPIGISYAAPISGHVTSSFGYRAHPTDGEVKFHYGVDIAASEGTPVTSFADGEVIAIGESATMGKYILLKHGAVESRYAHCGEIFVSSGQAVKLGDEIAFAGSTGNATAPCLHFELKIDGVSVNPEYYLALI